MNFYILVISLIIIVCIASGKLGARAGVPVLLIFIFLGMLFGSDGIFKIEFDNLAFSESVCTVALIFIMFYGGFGTNWRSARKVAVKSVFLSTAGVVLTAGLTGLFCRFVLGFDLLEAMLIGAVVSSTDAASVFSILRSKRLNLKYGTASILELESGSNDPCAYMLTVIILTLMSGKTSGVELFGMIFAQLLFGVVVGVVTALLSAFILKRLNLGSNGFDSVFVFASALVSYSASALMGGNGYLSVYITGIILGNSKLSGKSALVHFFNGLTGLMQILIFFLLGLVSFPSQILSVAMPALLIALFLSFVARPLSVFALLTPFKCPLRQQVLISWAGLRGAASIVFAIMAVISPAYLKNDIFHIVFFIVLFSILIQGTLIPLVAKKLDMIDDTSDVMKTFNDYTKEVPVQFIKLPIGKGHPWENKKLRDISLLPNTILALVIRGKTQLVPRGNTTLLEGDIAVMSGSSLERKSAGNLTEIEIDDDSEWLGRKLSQIKLDGDKLIIIIKRKGKIIIPDGSTVVKKNDVLIINEAEK